ncbi:hypothetical protein JOB18_005651 [Solea senegalensis]|uniref:Uncharacterized protein n=1 Tax=Solea senegalensis TaxID=28829 RepID=A0AAV6RAS2_SOLSE|nr:hypothetical protein JOB18_005651 [Solea senegalensis]
MDESRGQTRHTVMYLMCTRSPYLKLNEEEKNICVTEKIPQSNTNDAQMSENNNKDRISEKRYEEDYTSRTRRTVMDD